MQIHDRNPVHNLKYANKPAPEETADKPEGVETSDSDSLLESQKDNLKLIKDVFNKGVDKIKTGAEKTSEYFDKSPKAHATLDTLLQFFKTIKSYPNFIYPSLINMTGEERNIVLSQLDRLPLKDVGGIKSISMFNTLASNAGGGAAPLPSSPFILLSRDSFGNNENWARLLLTHETGHVVDYNTGLFGLPKLFSESSKSTWGKPPYITPYAETGPGWYPSEWDDLAESYAYYHLKPEELNAKCPEKFKRIEQLEKNGFFEQLIDRQEFRETGKFIGGLLEKAPYLQNGLAMISLVGGVVQAYKALGELKRSEKSGDERLKMNAIMNFAAGSCFASKILAVPGMAIEGAKSELNRSIEKNEITASQANAVVQATIGLVAGPLSSAINWVLSKLPWKKTYMISEETLKKLDNMIPPEKINILKGMENTEFTKKDIERLLEKLKFSDGEIEKVKQYVEKPSEPKKGDEVFIINDEVIEKMKGKLSEEKLAIIEGVKNRKFTSQEIEKVLKKADFEKDEVLLVRAYMVEAEKDPVQENDKKSGSIVRAALIGSGGAAGAVGGGFLGPYAGVIAGYALAGPIGGIVGLVSGAIIGFNIGARFGGRIGNLTGKIIEKTIYGKHEENPKDAKPDSEVFGSVKK